MTAIRQYPMTGGTSTTEGLVSYVVDGGWVPYLGFGTITNGHKVRYVATDGTQFEEGYGVKSNGPTLTRDTILRTSSGDTQKIDWGTGTRVVYVVADLDTTFEAEDLDFVHFLKAPQIESSSQRFRWWADSGTMYLSDATTAPFDHLLSYNALAVTPTLESDVPVDLKGGVKIAGVNLSASATAPFASEAQAQAGTSTTVSMHALATAQAMASGPLMIGARDYRGSPAATDEMLIHWSGGLARTNLSNVDELISIKAAGSVGSYVFAARENASTDIAFGGTVAGSALRPCGMVGNSAYGGTSTGSRNGVGVEATPLSGTWRCMGFSRRVDDLPNIDQSATLWLRIS